MGNGYAFGMAPGPLGGGEEQVDLQAVARGEGPPSQGTPAQPGFFQRLGTAQTPEAVTRTVSGGLGQVREATTKGIERVLAGGREPTLASRTLSPLLNPVPGSLPQLASAALTPAIMMAGGGILPKTAASGALNALLGYSEGGKLGALTGGVAGAAGGALGGAAARLRQPNQATRGLLAVGKLADQYGSPTVKATLAGWERDPIKLTAGATPLKMRRAASENIQQIVDDIAKMNPEGQIPLPSLDMGTGLKFKLPMTTDRMSGQTYPMGTFVELDNARVSLRQAGDPAWRYIEGEMIKFADQLSQASPNIAGTPLGRLYKDALNQYRLDQRLIDAVEWVQDKRAVLGGMNPTDFPGAQEAQRLMVGGGGDPAKTALYGAKAGLLGLGHPSNVFALNAMANALKSAGIGAGGAPITTQVIGLRGPLQKAVGTAGAAGAAQLPSAVMRLLPPPSSEST